jgi:thiosulfate/3-mercaptopyruvate sulfurtransferase
MSISAVLISPDQLHSLQSTEPVVVIDTRDADTFSAGHIPGAVNLREVFTFLATSTPEGLKELKETFACALGAAGLSGAETAVFYEDAMDSGYGQSCRGYYLLTWLGYPKIKVLNGGFSAWTAAGLPVSTEGATPTPATFPDLPISDVMLTQADVQAALGTDTVLLDVRDVDEWIGDSSSPYGKDLAPRKGRLPGAKWLEWYRFMKPSGQGPVFKTPDEVRAECATAGIAPGDTVYLYCFKGARASNTFLALKQAGFSDVRMYFGSGCAHRRSGPGRLADRRSASRAGCRAAHHPGDHLHRRCVRQTAALGRHGPFAEPQCLGERKRAKRGGSPERAPVGPHPGGAYLQRHAHAAHHARQPALRPAGAGPWRPGRPARQPAARAVLASQPPCRLSKAAGCAGPGCHG